MESIDLVRMATVMRVSDDFELESSIPPTVLQSSLWRTTDRKTAKDKWSCIERKNLPLRTPFIPYELNRRDSSCSALCNCDVDLALLCQIAHQCLHVFHTQSAGQTGARLVK
jgi:hypothetical protein